MMVTILDAPTSRAGSLPLIGDDLALDFANTESGLGFGSHQNHLRSAANVVEWLRHAQALSADATDWLGAEAHERPDLSAELLSRAVELREAIHRIGEAIGKGAPPSGILLDRLARQHARCISEGRLEIERGRDRWRWDVRAAPIEAALGPLALAAVKLFTEGDFSRIRQCAGYECGWLFYDRSKNNRRRWCEMEVCGNRAKQRRLAARRREA
jgi:predicted RNA-binding Zn ribbon-like protein